MMQCCGVPVTPNLIPLVVAAALAALAMLGSKKGKK